MLHVILSQTDSLCLNNFVLFFCLFPLFSKWIKWWQDVLPRSDIFWTRFEFEYGMHLSFSLLKDKGSSLTLSKALKKFSFINLFSIHFMECLNIIFSMYFWWFFCFLDRNCLYYLNVLHSWHYQSSYKEQVRLHLNVKLFNGIRMTGFVVRLFCIIWFKKYELQEQQEPFVLFYLIYKI